MKTFAIWIDPRFKADSDVSHIHEFLGIQAEIYFSFFHEREIEGYYKRAGFVLEFLERRNPYDFEIENERIFAIGRKKTASPSPRPTSRRLTNSPKACPCRSASAPSSRRAPTRLPTSPAS